MESGKVYIFKMCFILFLLNFSTFFNFYAKNGLFYVDFNRFFKKFVSFHLFSFGSSSIQNLKFQIESEKKVPESVKEKNVKIHSPIIPSIFESIDIRPDGVILAIIFENPAKLLGTLLEVVLIGLLVGLLFGVFVAIR